MMEFPLKGLIYANHAEKVNGHNRWDLKQCTLFTEEETKKLSESLSIMERLFFNLERSFSVEDVFHELSKELCNLKSDDIYGIRRVDRLFRTYVIEFQMFLDHWVRYISDLKRKTNNTGQSMRDSTGM